MRYDQQGAIIVFFCPKCDLILEDSTNDIFRCRLCNIAVYPCMDCDKYCKFVGVCGLTSLLSYNNRLVTVHGGKLRKHGYELLREYKNENRLLGIYENSTHDTWALTDAEYVDTYYVWRCEDCDRFWECITDACLC